MPRQPTIADLVELICADQPELDRHAALDLLAHNELACEAIQQWQLRRAWKDALLQCHLATQEAA